MKTIGIVGGTGFVGKYVTTLLVEKGFNVTIFTRDTNKKQGSAQVTYAKWDAEKGICDMDAIKKLDGVVHLAGAGIADKRWTEERKREILDSRVNSTDLLVQSINTHGQQCKVFVAASAIGIYGADDSRHTPFIEDSRPSDDFLGTTCRIWEDASQKAASIMRTVIIRIGIVLGKEGGAFPQFAQPMTFGVVPILGGGDQVVSWIEVEDLARLIIFGLEHDHMSGVYNGVAPKPETHKDLMKTIAKIKGGIKIPVPVPSFVIKAMLGEFSIEILKSTTVSAQKTLISGFKFNYPELDGAVRRILG